MTNKMTKKDYFATIKTIIENAECENKEGIIAFIDHEVELLARKSTKSSQTKTQKENVGVMETITAVLADAEAPMTVTQMLKDSRLVGFTNQKISALLRQMRLAGQVTAEKDKKATVFALV